MDKTFKVTVTRSYSTEVTVKAESPAEAVQYANRANFPLPPIEEWQGLKDWTYQVFDKRGDLLYEED